jgi:hypothetical protein
MQDASLPNGEKWHMLRYAVYNLLALVGRRSCGKQRQQLERNAPAYWPEEKGK